MQIREQIEADLKTAMRARDETARDTLRMVLAAIKKREIDEDSATTDADALAALRHAAKMRQDAASQFESAGRGDLAQKERAEMEVIARYLPRQKSEQEVRTIVENLVSELEIRSKQDLGKLMKAVMSRHKGEVDGKLVQRIAGELVG